MENYRKMLDQQINVKNQFKMYGNMTNVEKALNRNELEAYKNYDSNQYCLIPGLNSKKAIFDREKANSRGSRNAQSLSPGQNKQIDFE